MGVVRKDQVSVIKKAKAIRGPQSQGVKSSKVKSDMQSSTLLSVPVSVKPNSVKCYVSISLGTVVRRKSCMKCFSLRYFSAA